MCVFCDDSGMEEGSIWDTLTGSPVSLTRADTSDPPMDLTSTVGLVQKKPFSAPSTNLAPESISDLVSKTINLTDDDATTSSAVETQNARKGKSNVQSSNLLFSSCSQESQSQSANAVEEPTNFYMDGDGTPQRRGPVPLPSIMASRAIAEASGMLASMSANSCNRPAPQVLKSMDIAEETLSEVIEMMCQRMKKQIATNSPNISEDLDGVNKALEALCRVRSIKNREPVAPMVPTAGAKNPPFVSPLQTITKMTSHDVTAQEPFAQKYQHHPFQPLLRPCI